ncbi:hypothetical protein AVEN_14100-1 [Araneus ventricosus]|uniref:Uncharacterized protein n=1 Tax=Araneus ventricosus TaxID=182803 RepID=A0A4Y2PV93_ARAVE|nr:hypothetical protein AVEN_14100-1 [Araneus ventricosus]
MKKLHEGTAETIEILRGINSAEYISTLKWIKCAPKSSSTPVLFYNEHHQKNNGYDLRKITVELLEKMAENMIFQAVEEKHLSIDKNDPIFWKMWMQNVHEREARKIWIQALDILIF